MQVYSQNFMFNISQLLNLIFVNLIRAHVLSVQLITEIPPFQTMKRLVLCSRV